MTKQNTPGLKRSDLSASGSEWSEEASRIRRVDTFARVLDYLDEKTGGKRLPRRNDISPSELTDLLPNISILDLTVAKDGTVDDIVIRLMGTKIAHFYGEQTGQSFRDFPYREAANRVWEASQSIVDDPRPLALTVHGLAGGREHIMLEMLYHPLSEDGQYVDRVFCVVLFGFTE